METARCSDWRAASSWSATPAWHLHEAGRTSATHAYGSRSSSSWTTCAIALDVQCGFTFAGVAVIDASLGCPSPHASGTLQACHGTRLCSGPRASSYLGLAARPRASTSPSTLEIHLAPGGSSDVDSKAVPTFPALLDVFVIHDVIADAGRVSCFSLGTFGPGPVAPLPASLLEARCRTLRLLYHVLLSSLAFPASATELLAVGNESDSVVCFCNLFLPSWALHLLSSPRDSCTTCIAQVPERWCRDPLSANSPEMSLPAPCPLIVLCPVTQAAPRICTTRTRSRFHLTMPYLVPCSCRLLGLHGCSLHLPHWIVTERWVQLPTSPAHIRRHLSSSASAWFLPVLSNCPGTQSHTCVVCCVGVAVSLFMPSSAPPAVVAPGTPVLCCDAAVHGGCNHDSTWLPLSCGRSLVSSGAAGACRQAFDLVLAHCPS